MIRGRLTPGLPGGLKLKLPSIVNGFVISGNCSTSRMGVSTWLENRKSISWSGLVGEADVSFCCRRSIIFPNDPAAVFVAPAVETTKVAASVGSSEPMFVIRSFAVTVIGQSVNGLTVVV